MLTVEYNMSRQNPDLAISLRRAHEERNEAIAGVLRKGASLLVRFVDQWLVSPVKGWHMRHRLFQQLMSLDDRMLADIGVNRGNIPWVVEHGCIVHETARAMKRAAAEIHPFPATTKIPAEDKASDEAIPPLAA